MRVWRVSRAPHISPSDTEPSLRTWAGMAGLRHKARHKNRRGTLVRWKPRTSDGQRNQSTGELGQRDSYPSSADSSTTTDLGNSSRPASKTTSPTATCSKLWAQAGQARRMTVEGGSFFLPIRQTRRNRSAHLGQVATAKAMLGFYRGGLRDSRADLLAICDRFAGARIAC